MQAPAVQEASERNRALYDSFWEAVPDYARYNPGARHRRRLIFDLLSLGRCESLLDVGCGDGLFLRLLRRERPDIRALAGADLSPAQVERNRERLPGMDFYALDVQVGALDRAFDVVLCGEVVEHLEDQRAAFRHLAAMVNPGGRLLVTCPTGTMYATEKHFGHVHHPTRAELVDHARGAGLRERSVSNWGWPTYNLMKWATNVNPGW
ncbi:MAG: class I SAM-dependent methyltransferase, partial [Myxococcales bacterium]|nr:class I SAM-dependent methyltransferase [Myxococcales bacterium]